MDADKEGFLRDHRSMIQTIGRAARNENGQVIMYADKITKSMEEAIGETQRRRAKQEIYNAEHGITPKTIRKSADAIMQQTKVADSKREAKQYAFADMEEADMQLAADPVVAYMAKPDLEKLATKTQKEMEKAAKDLDFITAARLRDELAQIKDLIKHRD
jgi:excinuclease ABC subunit B